MGSAPTRELRERHGVRRHSEIDSLLANNNPMNVTHILLRSLMTQRFPMLPGARRDSPMPRHERTA
jgi:hypothetical protein